MIKLIEDEGVVKEKFPEGEYCYKFLKDDKMIGVASINKDNEDKVYIFIKKELRGNGYGKILFSEVIKELKNKGYSEVIIRFEKDNIQMLKIINHNGGKHLSTDNKIMRYVVPIL